MNDQYTCLQNQGPRSGDFLWMRTHQETTASYFHQLARFDFYSQRTAFNISTLAFKLKSSLLITFIPLWLVTVMFPFAAWLWVMNVALPNRQAGTRLPVRMPDVTEKYHQHRCPLVFVSVRKIHSSSILWKQWLDASIFIMLLGISTAILTKIHLGHVFTIRTKNVRRTHSIKLAINKYEPEELQRS